MYWARTFHPHPYRTHTHTHTAHTHHQASCGSCDNVWDEYYVLRVDTRHLQRDTPSSTLLSAHNGHASMLMCDKQKEGCQTLRTAEKEQNISKYIQFKTISYIKVALKLCFFFFSAQSLHIQYIHGVCSVFH